MYLVREKNKPLKARVQLQKIRRNQAEKKQSRLQTSNGKNQNTQSSNTQTCRTNTEAKQQQGSTVETLPWAPTPFI
jgi:hypothetical protein